MTVTVLHVAQPREGGVAAYVLAAARDQLARGWNVTVACPDGGRLADDLRRAAVPRRRWSAIRRPGPASLAEAARLRAIVDDLGPDVLHLHASKAGLAGRVGPRRRPVLFQPHGWSWLAADGPLRAASLAWERTAARRTDRLLCVGQAEAAHGRDQRVHGRYEVVRNGVDLERFRPADELARAAARLRLDLPVTAPLVVCPGRLTRQKGQDVLLTAWPRIRRQCPDARLILVGDGDRRDALAAAAGPGVSFAGPVADIQPWLVAADVVVLPSRWEGLSLTVLEAFATGRPVVASDVPGLAEVVGPDVGARVPADDPAALAAAVTRRLLEPGLAHAEGLAAAGHAAGFDLRLTFAQLAAVTEQVVEERTRTRSRTW